MMHDVIIHMRALGSLLSGAQIINNQCHIADYTLSVYIYNLTLHCTNFVSMHIFTYVSWCVFAA